MRYIWIYVALICSNLCGCASSSPESEVLILKYRRPGLLVIGQKKDLKTPLSYIEMEAEIKHESALTVTEPDLKNLGNPLAGSMPLPASPSPAQAPIDPSSAPRVLSTRSAVEAEAVTEEANAAEAEMTAVAAAEAAGSIEGVGEGAVGSSLYSEILDLVFGTSNIRYLSDNNGKIFVTPNSGRVAEFISKLRTGRVPVGFFDSFKLPVGVRVLLVSVPASAVLYIHGVPTRYSTIQDIYLSPEDIQSSTLELAGYIPCQVPSAIVPGLQLLGGQAALIVRCILVPLVNRQVMKHHP